MFGWESPGPENRALFELSLLTRADFMKVKQRKLLLVAALIGHAMAFVGCSSTSTQPPSPSMPPPTPPSPSAPQTPSTPPPPSPTSSPSDPSQPPSDSESGGGAETSQVEQVPPPGEGAESAESGSDEMSSREDGAAGPEGGQPEKASMSDPGSENPSGEPTEPGGPAVPEDARAAASGGSIRQGSQTAGERTAALDEELARSLAEFDGELLREQELLEKERREEASAAAAEEAASGAESGGYSGAGEYADTAIADVEAGAEGEELGGAAEQSEQQEVAEQEGEASGGSAGGGGGGRVPSDVGDGSDDDIIARQLREAAMTEDDPELREKLWEEYRDYKSGSSKS
jgi:hypothetical protein